MRLAIGSDHAGLHLKGDLFAYLRDAGYQVEDLGTYSTDSVDYPDVAESVARCVAAGEYDRGILICGTGIGMSISANKIPGIRAAVCHDTFSARMAREHNDANILGMGARVVGPGVAQEVVRVWCAAEFTGERHQRRVDKMRRLDGSLAEGIGAGTGQSGNA